MRAESEGELNFVDEINDIRCTLPLGKMKKKPTDYFSGEIKHKNKVVCYLYGSYLGFIEFDDVRYWEFRYIQSF